jgi:hypothetical protein
MLEVIGFIAIAYLIFKFAPAILEVGFKFAVVCLGLVAFLFLISWVWATISVTIS